MTTSPLIWVLTDDRAGNVNQALGVAEALDLPFAVKEINYTNAARLPNFLRGAGLTGVTAESRVGLVPPWPDLVIAAGRRSAPVSRWIKGQGKGGSFLVQVMHPGGTGLDDFGLIAVPNHDGPMAERPNLLRITGAPHRVTEARLEEAAGKWRPSLDLLPEPRIALMVGGATKNRPFTAAMARDLGRRASVLAKEAGGSLLVTTSRRTGEKQEESLIAELTCSMALHRWNGAAENPYFGYLALCDGVIVTGDSVSMCSEACGIGKPVYIYAPEGSVSDKHARLHEELYALGHARPLGEVFTHWTHPPLNAAIDIAKAVRDRMGANRTFS